MSHTTMRAAVAVVAAAAALVLSGCTTTEPVITPDMTGMTLDEAVTALEAEGIEADVSTTGHENYGTVPVVSTEPAAGEPVGWRGEVVLHVAPITVTNVVDGDTLDLSTGDRVRLIGIDAPEVGVCGADEATARVTEWALGREVLVENPPEVEDRDEHGRLLAYITVPGVVNDIGYPLISEGLAVPRYNSTDGYGAHPNEAIYTEGAAAATPFSCETELAPPPLEQPQPQWTCVYDPTLDRDWHNDVLCTNGAESERPYLRAGDSFVTEDEIMESAREYERQLNSQ